jgi:hypothetical protein
MKESADKTKSRIPHIASRRLAELNRCRQSSNSFAPLPTTLREGIWIHFVLFQKHCCSGLVTRATDLYL